MKLVFALVLAAAGVGVVGPASADEGARCHHVVTIHDASGSTPVEACEPAEPEKPELPSDCPPGHACTPETGPCPVTVGWHGVGVEPCDNVIQCSGEEYAIGTATYRCG